MALFDDAYAAILALDDFEEEMVTKHDFQMIYTEQTENGSERPGVVVRQGPGRYIVREFPFDPSRRQGEDEVQVEVYYPVRDDTENPGDWEAGRALIQDHVQAALTTLLIGRLIDLSWSGWGEVILSGLVTAYTSTTFRMTERLW